MKLPSHLSRFEPEIPNKLTEFDGKLTYDDVVSWVLQFKDEDQSLATRIFLKLRYYGSTEVQRLCKGLYSRLPSSVRDNPEETYFVGLGGQADSSSMIFYHYRAANDIPQARFLNGDGLLDLINRPSRSGAKHVIFIDDFIGTGGQAVTLIKKEVGEVLSNSDIGYVGFHALVGYVDGMKRITEQTKIDVIVMDLLSEKDRVFDEASKILTEDYFDLQRYRETIRRYGERVYPTGPLGYGGNQALIAFFYNTPNNTLPIIWAKTSSWTPLLPRTEPKKPSPLRKEERLVLMYVVARRGRCTTEDATDFGNELHLHARPVIDQLKKRHMLAEKENEFDRLIEITVKGKQRGNALFEEELDLARSVLRECWMKYEEDFNKDPRSNKESFSHLKDCKDELILLVELSCRVKAPQWVLRFQRTISWLLLKEHDYGERLRIGQLILDSFEVKTLLGEYRYVLIDDLGWTSIVNGDPSKAERAINAGLSSASEAGDVFGQCQAWRHLQTLKRLEGTPFDAEVGLRIIYGFACAIKESNKRLEMQAGVLRALALIEQKVGKSEGSELLIERSGILSEMAGEAYHAREERKRVRMDESGPFVQSAGTHTLFLVRHPFATKNRKHTFGPQMLDEPSELGERQARFVVSRLEETISRANIEDVQIFSAPSKATSFMATEISKGLGKEFKVNNLLDPVNSGDLNGYTEEDAAHDFPDAITQLKKYRTGELDGYAIEFPNGESARDLTTRLSSFLLSEVYRKSTSKYCILVGHNSSITAILNVVLAIDRWPYDPSYRYFEVPLGSVTSIELKETGCVIRTDSINPTGKG